MYNYLEAMKEDIVDVFSDYYNEEDLKEFNDLDELKEDLYDKLWIDDSVTGNASGSYTFNSYQAKENVMDNMDLCKEALEEFCVDAETIGEKFLNEDWEYLDVTIRCYLLSQAIEEAIGELEIEIEED